MEKIMECVPNFSEGRDASVISQITAEISAVDGAKLLDVSMGKDTNRTVVTFAGSPDAVVEAAFRAVRKAGQLIHMAVHRGAHPRMGATDVCPLVPVRDITLEECIEYAKRLGARIGDELKIPVYLYGEAATRPDRKKLPDIRSGGYEALPEKMKRPDFQPDYGPAAFNPSAGATAVGVRDFMLAYNVNLNTTDVKLAREIAMTLRESGRAKKDRKGQIVRDESGNPVQIPGKLAFCQAGGWFMDSFGYAQVTMNLHNYRVTGLHTAFDAVREEASKLGLRVTGSELIGLAPLQAVLDAGRHILGKQRKNAGIPESDVVHAAVHSLGLNETSPFNPEERIIEYSLREKGKRLADLSVLRFVDQLSSESPTPGGGSASALSGALSAALCSMVANLTYGRKETLRYNALMETVSLKAQSLKTQFTDLVDRDTDAFNAYMAATRMPKKTGQEQRARDIAVNEAARQATLIPFEILELAPALLELAEFVVRKGNVNAVSDAAVAAIQAEAAAEGARMNVLINLPMTHDSAFENDMRKMSETLMDRVRKMKKKIMRLAVRRLGK